MPVSGTDQDVCTTVETREHKSNERSEKIMRTLSPSLFKLYLEEALDIWNKKCGIMGIPLNIINLHNLSYADDQIIMAHDFEDIDNNMNQKLSLNTGNGD